MARRLAARGAVVAVAAAGVAWFGLGAVQKHDTDAAARIVAAPAVSAAQARRADSLLDTAGTLNPAQQITVLRAKLAFARGETGRARRLARAAAHAEPDNAQTWLALVELSKGTPELAPAFRHLVSLVPPVRGGA